MGKGSGQNGFKLSLLGYDSAYDYEALVQEARGRRVFLAAPDQSLLLLKATGRVAHGGAKRLDASSAEYQTLVHWIEAGAPPPRPSDPVAERLTVEPAERVFEAGVRQQPLKVTLSLSNGTQRDVTRHAVYQSNDPDVGDASDSGNVEIRDRSGLFAILVRYGDQMAVFHGTVPRPGKRPAEVKAVDAWETENARSFVDRHLAAQWRRLGIVPSKPASDAEFIRRATLDICGTLPSTAEVTAYVADADSDKRARLIDRLLERPEYASSFALKWADILRNRGKGNAVKHQRVGTALFSGWIRDCIAENMPYDRFVSEILTATGSQETNPPTVWYRTVRTSSEYVESIAQAFLGIRIQCAVPPPPGRAPGARPIIISSRPCSPAWDGREASSTPRCRHTKPSTSRTRDRSFTRGPGK